MLKKLVLATGLLLGLPTIAYAAACDVPKTGFDNVYCFAKVYMDLDRQLNDNYTMLMKIVDPAKKQVLRDG